MKRSVKILRIFFCYCFIVGVFSLIETPNIYASGSIYTKKYGEELEDVPFEVRYLFKKSNNLDWDEVDFETREEFLKLYFAWKKKEKEKLEEKRKAKKRARMERIRRKRELERERRIKKMEELKREREKAKKERERLKAFQRLVNEQKKKLERMREDIERRRREARRR